MQMVETKYPVVEWTIGVFDRRKPEPLPLSRKFTLLDWSKVPPDQLDGLLEALKRRSEHLMLPFRHLFVERNRKEHRQKLEAGGYTSDGIWGCSGHCSF